MCFEGCQLQCFLFLCDAFFLLKELWKSKEELRVPLQNWKEKKSLNRVFLLEVHHSHSLSESCRMRNLRLVSKSQMSCFRGEVSSYFWSKLGSTLNFKPFLHLYGFFFACASNSDCMRSITPHTCVGPPTHVLFYLSLPSLSRPYVLCSFSCSYGVPPSPSMFVGWLHCTHDRLARRSHRNCAALVRSGG